jgi:hypothetical protein
MPVSRCPHCSIALLDEEANGSHCPACGGELRSVEVVSAPAAPPPPLPVSRPWGWMVATGVLALVVLLQWLSWPLTPSAANTGDDGPLAALRSEKERAEQAAVASRAETARVRGEMQKQIAGIREEELAKRNAAESKQTEAEKKMTLADQRAKQAEERLKKEQDFLNASDELVKLNRPDADYLVKALNDGASLTLMGKVGTLRVEGVNGAFLDASRLEAKSIVFYQGINGRSMVKLHAPNGRVSLATINAEAQVEIDAPGGRTEIRDINGEAKLRVRTKELRLNGDVNGTSLLNVVFTKDGSLKFVRLQGECKLLWKKDAPTDPEPAITRGEIKGKAVLEDEE